MAEASDSSVLGDFDGAVFESHGISTRFYKKGGKFFVYTEGPAGDMVDFEIAYTFGAEPLQQYLVRFPGGRLQALSVAWDVERREWFHLYPDQAIPAGDWLHWTGGGQNWNGMCAECHSTNLQKRYDPDANNYSTTWSEIDVSCEACHGPGSRHVEWADLPEGKRPRTDNYGLVVSTGNGSSGEQIELCAPCHSRRTQIGDYDHRTPGLMDRFVPALLREDLYYADGQILDEVYVYGSFVQSKMHRRHVRCSHCHDVHSLKLVKPGNDLCLQCHSADKFDTAAHHFHKVEREGQPSAGAQCVKCHMPERPYMQVDWRADHSMRVPRPDLTVELGTPNACMQSGCHADQTAEWAAARFMEWYPAKRAPHFGSVFYAAREGDPGAWQELTRVVSDTLAAVVRATAVSLLGSYQHAEARHAVAAALKDKEALVRYAAVQSVGAVDAQELVTTLAPLLLDNAAAVRGQAASRLAGIPSSLFTPQQENARRRAIDEHVTAMEYALDLPFAAYNLGNLNYALGEVERAVHFYQRAIEIDARFYPAKSNLAMVYNQLGRNEDAEALLREVITDYPDRTDVTYSLALLLAEMNRHEECAQLLSAVARVMPEAARVHYNLGLTLQHLRRDSEARKALRHAVELDPTNGDYLFALADHYLRRGKPEDALRYAERLITVHPNDPAGHELKRAAEQALEE
jgi:tetratricopeptide (TPR) repeat protein